MTRADLTEKDNGPPPISPTGRAIRSDERCAKDWRCSSRSPFLSLVSEDRIRKTLALMNQPADARLTPEIAQGVCVRPERRGA